MTEVEDTVEKKKEKIRSRAFGYKESRIEKPTPRKRRVSEKYPIFQGQHFKNHFIDPIRGLNSIEIEAAGFISDILFC